MWLVASSKITDLAVIRDGKPTLWRDLRRFNAPIQLAVAAAHEVVTRAVAPAEAAVVSLAPCQSGSPELHKWIRDCAAGTASKVNPTWTLHAVDNLALSVLTIGLKNQAYCMGLGGSAGMVWAALEIVGERTEHEVIVLGGDQQTALQASQSAGFAMLFARERTPHVTTGRPTRLVGVERRRTSKKGSDPISLSPSASKKGSNPISPDERRASSTSSPIGATCIRAVTIPHSASGALAMLAALRAAPVGHFAYVVPMADGDGVDEIVVRWEVSA